MGLHFLNNAKPDLNLESTKQEDLVKVLLAQY